MKKVLFVLILGFTFVSSYSQNTKLENRTNKDISKFSELVQGKIPALALSTDQIAKVTAIFNSKNEQALAIDPYKIGKLNSVKKYQALEIDAYKEAMQVLSIEQKLAYKKNKEALNTND